MVDSLNACSLIVGYVTHWVRKRATTIVFVPNTTVSRPTVTNALNYLEQVVTD